MNGNMRELASRELVFYKEHLMTSVLPFWVKSVDSTYGGVFTCYDNYGYTLNSTDKYTWSQGRFLWIWSRIARLCESGILAGDSGVFLEEAQAAANFMEKNVYLHDGRCVFLLTREGNKKVVSEDGYDTSIYADCFVILGLSEYSLAKRDGMVLERALNLYDSVLQRIETGDYRTEPYPVPIGLRSHGISMILLNVSEELSSAMEYFQHPRVGDVISQCVWFMEDVMTSFRSNDGLMMELIPINNADRTDSLRFRHINPGHSLEDMWFVLQAQKQLGINQWTGDVLVTIKRTLELGWDHQYGGIFRFVDRHGGIPKGAIQGGHYEQLVMDTWDSKLWWTHSEALYSTLLAFVTSNDDDVFYWYLRIKDYVFNTFPQSDPSIGEWIQIRDRWGEPLNKVVALPVKDPFHIVRDILLIIQLLEDVK